MLLCLRSWTSFLSSMVVFFPLVVPAARLSVIHFALGIQGANSPASSMFHYARYAISQCDN